MSCSTSKCPFAGKHGTLWVGMLAGALLTYLHLESCRKKKTKSPIRAPGTLKKDIGSWKLLELLAILILVRILINIFSFCVCPPANQKGTKVGE